MHPVLLSTHPQSTSLLWQYIGSFALYTLLAVGAIYMAFLYLKKNPHLLHSLQQRQSQTPSAGRLSPLMNFWKKSLHSKQQSTLQQPSLTEGSAELMVESAVTLELQKTLYVIRSGQERFLIATSDQGIQLLTPLEAAPPKPSPVSSEEENTSTHPSSQAPEPGADPSPVRNTPSWFRAPLQGIFPI